MIDFFENLPPYLQALVAGIITWLLTALGAASVFIFKSVNKFCSIFFMFVLYFVLVVI